MYGGELDAVYRRVFAAAEAPVVGELDRGRLTLRQGLIEAEPHGEILLAARIAHLAALAIDHARDRQGIVELEGGRTGVAVERDETHFRGGGKRLRGRLDLGVDGVMLHSNARAALLRLRGGSQAYERQGGEYHRPEACCGPKPCRAATKHRRVVL